MWVLIKSGLLLKIHACGVPRNLGLNTITDKHECSNVRRSSSEAEIASEGLKGRVFEFSLGDLNNDEDLVSERNCTTIAQYLNTEISRHAQHRKQSRSKSLKILAALG